MIAPARTGSARSRRRTVIPTDHTNRGIRSNCMPRVRMFIMVVMKFKAPKMDETPAR